MTECGETNNVSTMTCEETDQFQIENNHFVDLSFDLNKSVEAQIVYIIETEKVQRNAPVHYIEEEYVPVDKRLKAISFKNSSNRNVTNKKTYKDVGILCQVEYKDAEISAKTYDTVDSCSNTF